MSELQKRPDRPASASASNGIGFSATTREAAPAPAWRHRRRQRQREGWMRARMSCSSRLPRRRQPCPSCRPSRARRRSRACSRRWMKPGGSPPRRRLRLRGLHLEEGTEATAVDTDRMGHVAVASSALDDTTLRSLAPLGLDGLYVTRTPGNMTLATQLQLVRIASFASAPLLVNVTPGSARRTCGRCAMAERRW